MHGPGVHESFEAFVAGRGDSLWRASWLLTGDTHLAQDLVQTALLRTWPHFERIEGRGGNFDAYVRRTIYRSFVGWTRRKWTAERPYAEPYEQRVKADEGRDADLRLDIGAALAELSHMQRAVLVCRYFDDLSERETAERLGCSVGSIKAHHSRAIKRLRASNLLTQQTRENGHGVRPR